MTDVCDERDVYRLLREARGLPHGPEKVACMERATRIADAIGSAILGFSTREGLIEAAEFSGAPEKSLGAFAWCLAQCDREPKAFPISRILWQYKWVADKLYIYPNMPRARIMATLDDVEARFRAKRWGMRGPRKLRLVVAMGMGERAAAREHYRTWSATRRDTGSDCSACDQRAKVLFAQFTGDHRRAARAAEPLIDGKLLCAEEPHRTTCMAMRSLLRIGRIDDAVECYERTRRRLRPTSSLYNEVAEHIEFLVLTQNLRRAQSLFERHLAGALASWDFQTRFVFLAAALLLIRAIGRSRGGHFRLRIAGETPLTRADGMVEPGEVDQWLERECRAIANAFDQRNGNAEYRLRLESIGELLASQRPVELP